MVKTIILYLIKKNKCTGELRNTKKTQQNNCIRSQKNSFPNEEKPFHNNWQDQENLPVNNQEKTLTR